MMEGFAVEFLATVAYAGVGLVLLVIGYFVIDLMTPGKLGELVFVERNRDAAYVLASGLGSIGLIVAGSIWLSDGGLLRGLLGTAAYGALGLVLLAVSYLVIDLLTPGKLGELLTDGHDDPGVWVKVVTQLSLGLIVVASIS